MSKSLNSPTARLLQGSRLFSLPRPLPPPALDTATAQGQYRNSDSATLPYPVLQAIATPASSYYRGDWGLKRPLPKKATGSTAPTIRVRAQDNWEHITDFQSAGDHVRTEQKWQQMGVPLVIKERRSTYSNNQGTIQSVYDEHVDITDPDAANSTSSVASDQTIGSGQSGRRQRWKFEGPWIPGLQEGEFNEYLARNITKRKAAFKQFLFKQMLERRIHDEERANRESGRGGALTTERIQELRKDVEKNYDAEEKKMRDEHVSQNLSSDLTATICDFLDLPGVRMSGTGSLAQTRGLQDIVSGVVAETGPPSTHPGAGLSHIRTNAFLENHQFWGAQAHRSPVKARVLRPRSGATFNDYQAKLGVAGIVTNDPITAAYQPPIRALPGYEGEEKEEHHLDSDRMTYSLDENLPGGNKIWVQPETASIDEDGHIRLEVSRGDKEAIAVRRNKVQEIHEARSASFSGPGYVAGPRPGETANYGYSLPDTRKQPRPGVRGFDEELGRGPRQGRMSNKDASAKIRDLLYGASGRPVSRR